MSIETQTPGTPQGDLRRSRLEDTEGVELSRDEDGAIVVTRLGDDRPHRSLHGLVRSLIFNMVEGVTNGYERRLELIGVGYRALQKGSDLEIQVGYSHPVAVPAPEGITLQAPTQTEVIVSGSDKQLVGQVAANIRKIRPPEPYKGKGIKYAEETIRRKAGKAAGR